MGNNDEVFDKIFSTLKEKGSMKQDVYRKSGDAFKEMKSGVQKLVNGLRSSMQKVDKSVVLEFDDKGEFEFRVKLGGDLLIFLRHTNVFDFDKSHNMWRSSYIKEDPLRSYCGMINVYNFLADSFKYHRVNDLGYLIARVFINKDNHYFVEGKRQLGFLYNDFTNAVLQKGDMLKIAESAILYSLDFDLLTPPYQDMSQVSVHEIFEVAQASRLKTGKRLGFRFQADSDQFE